MDNSIQHTDEIIKVAVIGHQVRGFQEGNPYVVYVVHAGTKLKNWKVYRRYSEFADLDSTFSELFPESKVPVKLPPKTLKWFVPFDDADVVEARERGLEQYLKVILSCSDARWRNTGVWRSFLLPPSGVIPSYSVSLPVPDSRRGSSTSTAAATTASSPSRRGSNETQTPLFKNWSSPLDKTLVHQPSNSIVPNSEAARNPSAEEQLKLQNEVMQMQDKTLEELAGVIGRQKELGQAIGDEIEAQNDLLLDIELNIDTTGSKMKTAAKRLDVVRSGM